MRDIVSSPRPAAAKADGSLIRTLADNSDAASLANRMRRARFAFFLLLLQKLDSHATILDVGGTQDFWDRMTGSLPSGCRVTLLNTAQQRATSPDFVSAVGDARSMPQYPDRSFDVAFSNSVIEHVGDYEQQQRMAREMMRVGKRYFVQTPNKRFPLEPHFLVPWFQYLPSELRARLVNRFDIGWYRRIPDLDAARAEVDSIQLLTRRRFEALFPGARLYTERFAGLQKSFIAYGGWD
jgi:hypothetical protein